MRINRIDLKSGISANLLCKLFDRHTKQIPVFRCCCAISQTWIYYFVISNKLLNCQHPFPVSDQFHIHNIVLFHSKYYHDSDLHYQDIKLRQAKIENCRLISVNCPADYYSFYTSLKCLFPLHHSLHRGTIYNHHWMDQQMPADKEMNSAKICWLYHSNKRFAELFLNHHSNHQNQHPGKAGHQDRY